MNAWVQDPMGLLTLSKPIAARSAEEWQSWSLMFCTYCYKPGVSLFLQYYRQRRDWTRQPSLNTSEIWRWGGRDLEFASESSFYNWPNQTNAPYFNTPRSEIQTWIHIVLGLRLLIITVLEIFQEYGPICNYNKKQHSFDAPLKKLYALGRHRYSNICFLCNKCITVCELITFNYFCLFEFILECLRPFGYRNNINIFHAGILGNVPTTV